MEQTRWERAWREVREMVDKNLDVFVRKYPHVSKGNVYEGEENTLWTSSFFPGMCYLAYEMTGDKKYLKYVPDYLDSFEERLEKRRHISHDLGFLYTLTCVADYKLTKDDRAYEIAKRAARMLCERYNQKGKYIQAWGEMGIGYPDVKIIIDTMLNLPLLYWTTEPEMMEIARNHAHTAADYLIRNDFSSYHTYLMDPETGKAVEGKTHQGHRDESTWARGQAWAVYGFTLSYRYTKEERFLTVAKNTAKVFADHLPKDFVPYWDFDFTDEDPDIRDTSAAAIAACGFLELCRYCTGEEKSRYQEMAEKIVESLYENYSSRRDEKSNGVLLEGVYHRNDGAEECVIWGDYFYAEALVRLIKPDWEPYW